MMGLRRGELILLVVAGVLAMTGCSGIGGMDKGSRMLGMEIQIAEDQSMNNATRIAMETGMDFTQIPVYWDMVEPSEQIYTSERLEMVDAFYPPKNIRIAMGLYAIDTNNKKVPRDLLETDFDDPVMISRYKAMLDYALPRLSHVDIRYLMIGNEIDAYLLMDDEKWRQFITFYKGISSYVKSRLPGVKVGVKGTFNGMMNDAIQPFFKEINQYSDLTLTTYYPFIHGTWEVADPTSVHRDFERLVEAFPGKPIEILECGYPTSEDNGSSEQKQAEFVRELFKAWDKHKDQITGINFCTQTDWPPHGVAYYKEYYGIGDKGFLGYLGSFGFRYYSPGSGRDKEGFRAIREEARKRGWRRDISGIKWGKT